MQIKLFTIPNLFTLANLLCGAFAAVAALVYGDTYAAFWLIVAAVLFDFCDGFVARLLHQSSPIGVQLDSLADDIASGFAPAAILFTLYRRAPAWFEWSDAASAVGGGAIFLLAAFAALRLARFNIDDTQASEFRGLPAPAAALLCASLGVLEPMGLLACTKECLVGVALVLSWLMVSPIRMFSLKFHGFGWQDNSLRYLFLLTCLMLIFVLGAYAIPSIIVLYVVLSTVRWIACGAGRKQTPTGNGD